MGGITKSSKGSGQIVANDGSQNIVRAMGTAYGAKFPDSATPTSASPVANSGLSSAEEKAAKRRARRGRGGPGLLSSQSLGNDSATLGSVVQ